MPEKSEARPEQTTEVKEGELTFRDLRIEDCDDMVKVVNSIVDEGAPIRRKEHITIEEQFLKLQEWIDGVQRKEGMCIGIERDGHLVGWIAGVKSPKATDVPTALIGDAEILKSARSYQNFHDLGKLWIERAQKEWGTKRFILWTSTKNRARNLYKRFGFKEAGIIPAEQKGVDDYVEMEMTLE